MSNESLESKKSIDDSPSAAASPAVIQGVGQVIGKDGKVKAEFTLTGTATGKTVDYEEKEDGSNP